MPLISMRELLDHAAENGYGVPAFNVNNMEQIHAIMEAADETDSPVIVQASAGARKYARPAFLRHLVEAAIETWPRIPIVMHQDHGASPGVCQRSIQLGFSSVPRKFLTASTNAMREICKARYEAFGSAGQASKMTPLGLEVMARRYESGELVPTVH